MTKIKFFLVTSFLFMENIIASPSTWIDRDTDLMWELKSEYNIMNKYTWSEASEYCESLYLNGENDWWLPATAQLKSISNIEMYGGYNDDWEDWFLDNEENKNNGYFIKTYLQYNIGTEGDYWSLSDDISNARSEEEEAWFIDFEAGYDDWSYISTRHYVRCVRSSQ